MLRQARWSREEKIVWKYVSHLLLSLKSHLCCCYLLATHFSIHPANNNVQSALWPPHSTLELMKVDILEFPKILKLSR